MDFAEFSTIAAHALGLDAAALDKFQAMEALYSDWNSKINVISRKDIGELYSHHVLHSLSIAYYIRHEQPALWDALSAGGLSVLDLGTGGGFPGIPLAVVFPLSEFTLCDSIGKKLKVAGAVAEELGLSNVRLHNGRAEELRQSFDLVVSRAVAPLDKFHPWVKGKYRDSVLYLKGGLELPEEIAALAERQRIPISRISTWPVSEWLCDEWFDGKFVVRIASGNSAKKVCI